MPPEKRGRGRRSRRGGSREDGGSRGNGAPRVRPLWSGTVSFGLVSIPVDLYPAHRTESVGLRMLSPSGTPLRREYYNPESGRGIETTAVERGYQLETGEFVRVTDEELEGLEPERTRDIALERFVPVDQLDPIYFDRAYFLTPREGSAKAYRLLAGVMEKRGRAGVARFVMRSREYLVAILASDGVLRGETLRFADEVRSPEDVGLPEAKKPPKKMVEQARQVVRALAAEELPEDELVNEQVVAMRELVREKRERDADVVETGEAESAETGVIDLMAVLKRSLEQGGEMPERAGPRRADGGGAGAGRTRGSKQKPAERDELDDLTKDELYAMARRMDIAGRSGMKKDELVDAIRRSA